MNVKIHNSRVLTLVTAVFVFLVLFCNSSWAISEQVVTDSASLVFDKGDGVLHSVHINDCTDPVMSGDMEVGRQFCLCQGVAFRVAQAIVHNWSDSVFHVDDVRVNTGWNSDGPEEFFVDKLGMTKGRDGSFNYDTDITPLSKLSLQDAWYEITILSLEKTLMIRATDALYGVPDEMGKALLDYRRDLMAGKLNYKLKVKNLKDQAGERLRANPFDLKSFSMTETSNP